MIERLVENWLDSASERSYQPCFCQMLLGRGYKIIHSTEHTPLEHGKDVLAISSNGRLAGFQLKGNPGGTLKPSGFNSIRGQLEQLATLAVGVPGYGQKVPDDCYLVTNGEIDEDVQLQLQQLNAALVSRGHPADKIKVISRGELLRWATDLGLSLWPSEMSDFKNIVRLLNYEGNEPFPSAVLDPLLRHTLALHKTLKKDELRRRITSAAILTAVTLHSFSRRSNHYAEVNAWTLFAAYTIAATSKAKCSFKVVAEPAIAVAKSAIYAALSRLCDEIRERPALKSGEHYLGEGNPFSEFAFYEPRALLLHAAMAAYWFGCEAEGWAVRQHKDWIEHFVPRTLPYGCLWGEGAFPGIFTTLWFRKRLDSTAAADKELVKVFEELLANKLHSDDPLASPYNTVEDVWRHRCHAVLGTADPFEGESFARSSYFAESVLVALVRSNLKTACQLAWADFTRLSHERVHPGEPWQYCLYRADDATNETKIYPNTLTWADLQLEAKEVRLDIPTPLKDDPILLLLFVNQFPWKLSLNVFRHLHRQFDGDWFF